jgi:hypothetical protein
MANQTTALDTVPETKTPASAQETGAHTLAQDWLSDVLAKGESAHSQAGGKAAVKIAAA